METTWEMFLKAAFDEKPDVKKNKAYQHPDVVSKHRVRLEGTGFEACAICPGCPGKAQSGLMRCSNAGAKGELITIEQASLCRGDKPRIPLVSRPETSYRAAA